MSLNLPAFRQHLAAFDFTRLFVDVLGWNNPPADERDWRDDQAKDIAYSRRMVAELAGVAVLNVVTGDGWPDENRRMALWHHISQRHHENLIIFTDRRENPGQSLWYWVKRGKDPETGKLKTVARRHEYFRGQPVDLFASKLHALVVELSELDAAGRLPVLEVARRLAAALDVERGHQAFLRPLPGTTPGHVGRDTRHPPTVLPLTLIRSQGTHSPEYEFVIQWAG